MFALIKMEPRGPWHWKTEVKMSKRDNRALLHLEDCSYGFILVWCPQPFILFFYLRTHKINLWVGIFFSALPSIVKQLWTWSYCETGHEAQPNPEKASLLGENWKLKSINLFFLISAKWKKDLGFLSHVMYFVKIPLILIFPTIEALGLGQRNINW